MNLGKYDNILLGYKAELSSIKPDAKLLDVSKLQLGNDLIIFVTYKSKGVEKTFRFKSIFSMLNLRNPADLKEVIVQFGYTVN